MSPVRQDFLLRMIEEAFDVIRRIRLRRQDGDPAAAVRDADAAVDALLGPAAGVATRLDPSTAAQLIRNPEQVALWARILADKAEALREAGNEPGARLVGRRALETALEAWLLEDEQRRLTPALHAVLDEALAMARGWVEPGELSARHRAVLERV
ncbi:MAG TPA: hypothetical protein VF584_14805 [Longimicrobium sp.]|jgi:hypothetical protein